MGNRMNFKIKNLETPCPMSLTERFIRGILFIVPVIGPPQCTLIVTRAEKTPYIDCIKPIFHVCNCILKIKDL